MHSLFTNLLTESTYIFIIQRLLFFFISKSKIMYKKEESLNNYRRIPISSENKVIYENLRNDYIVDSNPQD